MNEMRRLMEAVEHACEEITQPFTPFDTNDYHAEPVKISFLDKVRYRSLHRRYTVKYIYAKSHNLPDSAAKAKDLAEYYGYLAGENDISDRNLRRIMRQYEFDNKGRLIEAYL